MSTTGARADEDCRLTVEAASLRQGRAGQEAVEVPLPLQLEGVVRVKPSSVHGLGLFALRDIPRNKLLGRYGGRIVKAPERDADYAYSLDGNSGWFIDGARCNAMTWARYINHGDADRNENNCVFTASGTVRVIRNIAAGQELLVDYGGKYWSDDES